MDGFCVYFVVGVDKMVLDDAIFDFACLFGTSLFLDRLPLFAFFCFHCLVGSSRLSYGGGSLFL